MPHFLRWRRLVLPAAAFGAVLIAVLPAGAAAPPAEGPLPRLRALREEGRLAEALAEATAAVEREPARRDLRMERGYLLGALGRHEEALAEYEVILADNPADVEALLEHAQVKTLQGKYDEAEGEFRFALAVAPGSPGALFGLGDVLTWKGELAGARAAYGEYVRARPRDPRGHARLGNVALLAGNLEEARARFREALRLDPADVEARAGLARTDRLAARDYRFRFDLGVTYETLTRGQPDWRQGSMLFSFRPWRGTEFTAGASHFNRFGQSDQLVSIGFSQAIFRYLTLSGNFSQGLNNGRLLPKQIYEGQLAIQAAPFLQLFTSYHFADFRGNTTAGTVSPGLQVGLHGEAERPAWWRRFSLLGRYFRSEVTDNIPANAFLVQIEHDSVLDAAGRPRFQPYLGAARGGLAAGAITTEELKNANSQFTSLFAGFTWRILPRFGLKADYAVQAVKAVYTKHSFGLSTFVEF